MGVLMPKRKAKVKLAATKVPKLKREPMPSLKPIRLK